MLHNVSCGCERKQSSSEVMEVLLRSFKDGRGVTDKTGTCDRATESQSSTQFGGRIKASRDFGDYLNTEKVWEDLQATAEQSGDFEPIYNRRGEGELNGHLLRDGHGIV